MTERSPVARLARWLAPVVPAQRLALVRIAVLLFACGWLVSMGSDLLARAQLGPDRFIPLGIAGWLGIVPVGVVAVVLVLVVLLGLGAAAGRGYRVVAPVFALGLLWLLSYRNSWGHLSHAEHLLVLHVGIVAVAPAADALRLGHRGLRPDHSDRYGWPLRLMMLVTVSTYAIAGLAKLQAGGMEWISGNTVQLHVAHEVLRTRLVGVQTATLGRWLLPHAWVFGAIAVTTVVLELGAPLALRSGRVRMAWLGGLWAMHLGIWAVMGIGFPYPLSGVAFVAFFPVEAWVERAQAWLIALHTAPP